MHSKCTSRVPLHWSGWAVVSVGFVIAAVLRIRSIAALSQSPRPAHPTHAHATPTSTLLDRPSPRHRYPHRCVDQPSIRSDERMNESAGPTDLVEIRWRGRPLRIHRRLLTTVTTDHAMAAAASTARNVTPELATEIKHQLSHAGRTHHRRPSSGPQRCSGTIASASATAHIRLNEPIPSVDGDAWAAWLGAGPSDQNRSNGC